MMKCICIKNIWIDRIDNSQFVYKIDFTIGNIYDILPHEFEETDKYWIRNDRGSLQLLPKFCFMTLEELRDEKLNILLNES